MQRLGKRRERIGPTQTEGTAADLSALRKHIDRQLRPVSVNRELLVDRVPHSQPDIGPAGTARSRGRAKHDHERSAGFGCQLQSSHRGWVDSLDRHDKQPHTSTAGDLFARPKRLASILRSDP